MAVCRLVVEQTLSDLDNSFDFYTMYETLVSSCYAPSVFNYTHRYVRKLKYAFGFHEVNYHDRVKNYTHLCLEQVTCNISQMYPLTVRIRWTCTET